MAGQSRLGLEGRDGWIGLVNKRIERRAKCASFFFFFWCFVPTAPTTPRLLTYFSSYAPFFSPSAVRECVREFDPVLFCFSPSAARELEPGIFSEFIDFWVDVVSADDATVLYKIVSYPAPPSLHFFYLIFLFPPPVLYSVRDKNVLVCTV